MAFWVAGQPQPLRDYVVAVQWPAAVGSHSFESTRQRPPAISGSHYRAAKAAILKDLMLQREEAIASIKRELDKTARWRTELSLRYPDDKRNERSAKVLQKLADRAHDMNDSDWESIQPLFAADSCKFNEAVSRVAHRIGFRLRQPGARFFLHVIVGEFHGHGDVKVAA